MMKKIIAIMITITAAFAFAACNIVPAKTYNATSDDCFDFVETEDGYAISVKEGADLPATLRLPETHNGKAVTEVSVKGFYGAEKVVKLVVPKSYKKIGGEAFALMPSLRTAEIGVSGTTEAEEVTVGWGAFKGGEESSLSRVELGDKVVSLGEYAFADNAKLSLVKVGKGLGEVYDSTFENCAEVNFTLDDDNAFLEISGGALKVKEA